MSLFRLLLPLLLLSSPAVADVWSFATPSGNIECVVGEGFEGADIECTIYARSAPMAQFPGCPVNRGITVFMLNTGNVKVSCTAYGKRAMGAQDVANYGVEGNFGGFKCFSATTGLQCRNESGHGFHLSRRNQSVF